MGSETEKIQQRKIHATSKEDLQRCSTMSKSDQAVERSRKAHQLIQAIKEKERGEKA